MKHRTAYAVLKATSIIRLEEDHSSVILVAMPVQCNARAIGLDKFGEQAINHFGRIHEPKRLTPDNAWRKEYDYHYQPNSDNHQRNWRFVNRLTKETRSLTKEQYDDDNLVRP